MKIKFSSAQPGFHAAVRRNVNQYFKANGIGKNANGEMFFKSGLWLGMYVFIYALIMSNHFSAGIMLVLALLMGITHAMIGFNISHDAIHGSYSSSHRVNKLLSLTFHMVGANAYMWNITHNKVHHTFTNVPGHDEDLEVAPGLIRLCPEDEYKSVMKYQHIYAFALYCLSSLSWVLRKDYKKFFQKKIGEMDTSNHPRVELYKLIGFKLAYYALFIAAPLLFLDITFGQFLIGFLSMHFIQGLILGLVFQLAHVVEQTEFPEPDEFGNMEDSWAVHQMNTTADFARSSKMANFFCGGLNFQIEHHLFPNICHVHYPAISDIVKSTAHEYSVPFHENETFVGALRSHYRSLKLFGQPDKVSDKVELAPVEAY
jgi:linoleoyl-CoA desaturase